jgi:hypothetical protein
MLIGELFKLLYKLLMNNTGPPAGGNPPTGGPPHHNNNNNGGNILSQAEEAQARDKRKVLSRRLNDAENSYSNAVALDKDDPSDPAFRDVCTGLVDRYDEFTAHKNYMREHNLHVDPRVHNGEIIARRVRTSLAYIYT